MKALLLSTKTSSSWSWPRALRNILTCTLLLQGAFLFAQHNTIPLQWDIYYDLDKNHSRLVSLKHTAMRPYTQRNSDLNNVIGFRVDSSKYYYTFTQKLFKENLVIVDHEDLHMTIDFVFDFSFGMDIHDGTEFADTTFFYNNTRGFRVAGDLGKKLSFQSNFYENQSLFPQYLNLFTKKTGVVPGQGRAKSLKGRVLDYGWASGTISYQPTRYLNIQFGHDKHFIGNGYRSLLLSDVSFNYPFLKLAYSSDNHRLQYNTIYARLQGAERLPIGDTPESLFKWKGATFNFLSYNVCERLQIGLFEGTMWQVMDSTGTLPYNYMRLNPAIGVNTAVYGLDGNNNIVVGLDLKFKATNKMIIYGQFALDDPSTEKYGYQIGTKIFDLLTENLFFQLEYNKVTPFTFSHRVPLQNYAHFSEAMGHQYGAYFDELVTILQYRKKKWTFRWKTNLARYNLDGQDGKFGGDIFRPDNGVVTEGTPLRRDLVYHDVSVGWLMNQMTNMNITGGIWWRDLSNAPDHLDAFYVYLAWRTSLFNKYYDF